ARVAAAVSFGADGSAVGSLILSTAPSRSSMDRLRHRDRLLSLKYSTIEACFSVPMLNITLPSFPFVLAFAVQGLGWSTGAIGLMAALPHVCNCLQPLLL